MRVLGLVDPTPNRTPTPNQVLVACESINLNVVDRFGSTPLRLGLELGLDPRVRVRP